MGAALAAPTPAPLSMSGAREEGVRRQDQGEVDLVERWVIHELSAGREVTLRLTGGSMWPLVRSGEPLTLAPLSTLGARARVGEVCLSFDAGVAEGARLSDLHRVMWISSERVWRRGDALPHPPSVTAPEDHPLSPHEWRWVAYCFAFMLIIGVTEKLHSALMPLIKSHLGVSDQGLSGLIMVGTAGSMLFQLFSGWLITRFGHLRLYHASCFVCVSALSCAPSLGGYGAWLAFFLALYSGFTLFSLSTNTLIPRLGARAAVLLNLTHGCYGLGAMLSPLADERLLAGSPDWRASYATLAAYFALMWVALAALSPRVVPAVARDTRGGARPSLLSLAVNPF